MERKRELVSLTEKELPHEWADDKWTDDLVINSGVN